MYKRRDQNCIQPQRLGGNSRPSKQVLWLHLPPPLIVLDLGVLTRRSLWFIIHGIQCNTPKKQWHETSIAEITTSWLGCDRIVRSMTQSPSCRLAYYLATSIKAPILYYHICSFLGYSIYTAQDIPTYVVRENRGIRYPQAIHTLDPQTRIQGIAHRY